MGHWTRDKPRAFGKPDLQNFLPSRASFELSEDLETKLLNRTASRESLSGYRTLPTTIEENDEYEQWQNCYPSVLANFQQFASAANGKRLAVFLDYDGTLTPIVSNPDLAILSEEMRCTVRALAKMFPTAIISGRGREKVENFLNLRELFYAGSHGLDIAGPTESLGKGCFQPALQFLPLIDQVSRELTEKLKLIPGASVENNKFCVSAHFRNCAPESWTEVVKAVESSVRDRPELRMTRGRKVLEVRPKVDWDKGKALSHLLEVLGLKSEKDVLSIYIGDDQTDEDAFKVLKNEGLGFGILVSSKVKPTEAVFTVKDPSEVQQFLLQVVQWGTTASNGWYRSPSCNGWSPVFKSPQEAQAVLSNGLSNGAA